MVGRFCVLTISEKVIYDKRKIIGIVTAFQFFVVEKALIVYQDNYS
jgi:hypothetical protein